MNVALKSLAALVPAAVWLAIRHSPQPRLTYWLVGSAAREDWGHYLLGLAVLGVGAAVSAYALFATGKKERGRIVLTGFTTIYLAAFIVGGIQLALISIVKMAFNFN
jgi:hypothetical protein